MLPEIVSGDFDELDYNETLSSSLVESEDMPTSRFLNILIGQGDPLGFTNFVKKTLTHVSLFYSTTLSTIAEIVITRTTLSKIKIEGIHPEKHKGLPRCWSQKEMFTIFSIGKKMLRRLIFLLKNV